MKTTIHTYNYDVSKPTENAAYTALCARMAEQGTKCFETWGNGSHYTPAWDGRAVELETAFIFDNQWNTAPIEGITDKGLRVFDWAQDYQPHTKYLKRGHYLDPTPEIIEARENRLKCGYCGKQYDKRENPPAFCSACLGSQYLKADELKLTRVESVIKQGFAPLTPEETAELMPLYLAEQAGKGSERSRKAREQFGAKIKQDREAKTAKIAAEYDGKQWLFDRGCSLRVMENCIYYDHTKQFSFGWRDNLTAGADLDWLLENLSKFPYEYKIETTHRGTLGGRE